MHPYRLFHSSERLSSAVSDVISVNESRDWRIKGNSNAVTDPEVYNGGGVIGVGVIGVGEGRKTFPSSGSAAGAL